MVSSSEGNASPRFLAKRRVEFRDTDAAGIVHFSAFFPIIESVEHEFLRSVGISVMPDHDDANRVTWPRVSARCDYQGPARFEDVLDVALYVDRIGASSVTYRFGITCHGRDVATGEIVVVCCRLTAGGQLSKAAIPEDIKKRLEGESG
ncbi:4-hydroxybenzoyl-CoA thioesterase/acyl-CoA thioester hydrolase [Neorhodopirellula lusitana]|uniref:4-hydroxybenzoyl-CoA thioesterase/acyl-CoA thioester hydrolase n=1 Tax=Neorhodopirellula lusitana TaxID=445327 RepID=A0ABY1QD97_9BACT|nr:thioesterase family protein [Neorhodopirellula lusitana]SMP66071.1 4-hydroxybenzoyl-CoA thioesterase/acyl-CoA thioester hydrolase [Neorhodopirellula lusitana]